MLFLCWSILKMGTVTKFLVHVIIAQEISGINWEGSTGDLVLRGDTSLHWSTTKLGCHRRSTNNIYNRCPENSILICVDFPSSKVWKCLKWRVAIGHFRRKWSYQQIIKDRKFYYDVHWFLLNNSLHWL